MVLCAGSYFFLTFWRRRRERDDELFAPFSWEDEMVYKVSFAICAFSLAVSAGAALLLPISTISNEVLHRYPDSWYIKWLNGSLIQGIWNLIFLLSNFCLFLFLPFAYLFCESEGLPFFGHKRVSWFGGCMEGAVAAFGRAKKKKLPSSISFSFLALFVGSCRQGQGDPGHAGAALPHGPGHDVRHSSAH